MRVCPSFGSGESFPSFFVGERCTGRQLFCNLDVCVLCFLAASLALKNISLDGVVDLSGPGT